MFDIFEYIDDERFEKIKLEFNIKNDEFNIVKEIINIEWNFLNKVNAINGRAICQDSPLEFIINRLAQYLAYNHDICSCIQKDYKKYLGENFNPIFGKYARMMRLTDPTMYDEIKISLPQISPVKEYALNEISEILDKGLEKVSKILKETSKNARPRKSFSHIISSIDYYISEISFFNLRTIWLLRDYIFNINADVFIENVYKNAVKLKNILS